MRIRRKINRLLKKLENRHNQKKNITDQIAKIDRELNSLNEEFSSLINTLPFPNSSPESPNAIADEDPVFRRHPTYGEIRYSVPRHTYYNKGGYVRHQLFQNMKIGDTYHIQYLHKLTGLKCSSIHAELSRMVDLGFAKRINRGFYVLLKTHEIKKPNQKVEKGVREKLVLKVLDKEPISLPNIYKNLSCHRNEDKQVVRASLQRLRKKGLILKVGKGLYKIKS
jgi:hypothetical protein